jgi:hypothetical protein
MSSASRTPALALADCGDVEGEIATSLLGILGKEVLDMNRILGILRRKIYLYISSANWK